MTLANFKLYLAAYMNRTLATLTSIQSQDIVLQAINDARRQAQRDHLFELNATEDAYLATHCGGADWTTGCKTSPGGATAILMRQINEVWTYGTLAIGASTYYPRTARVPFSSTYDFKANMPVLGYNINYIPTNPPTAMIQTMFAYSKGTQLFVTTITSATNYKLIGYKWLGDLADGDSPDIFLTFFTDWLLLATITNLNVFLKDAERFPIDLNMMERKWESVKQMDGQLAQQGESANLD